MKLGGGGCIQRTMNVGYFAIGFLSHSPKPFFQANIPAVCFELRITNQVSRNDYRSYNFAVSSASRRKLLIFSRKQVCLTFTYTSLTLNHSLIDDGQLAQYARRLGWRGKKYPSSVRVGGVLLTSLNMLQHPSATRSIASLGRSIPMPVRQHPPAPSISSPLLPLPPFSYTPVPLSCSTTDRPPIPSRAFYRRLCVLRQWQTDLNPPALPLSPALDPLVPPQPSRPPSSVLNDVTRCPTLRSAKFISQYM